MQLFGLIFGNLINTGTLRVTDVDGKVHVFAGRKSGRTVGITFKDAKLQTQLFYDPEMAVGEGYMNGTLTIDDGVSLYDFLDMVYSNYIHAPRTGVFGLLLLAQMNIRRWLSANPLSVSRSNVAHHYDLSDELFELFLDADKQYSCAYFKSPDVTLEQAQIDKKHHIAAKLLIKPGMKVLDIGCGWGGMALTLAKDYGADVTGITLSEHQLAIARKRAADAGLSERCRFELIDYRKHQGVYDRVVSVGMYEHVGLRQGKTYFRNVSRLLNDDGVALIHTIAKFREPTPIPSWTDKYIFPGAYVPTLSELTPAAEKSGLFFTDIEILRLHYAETLRHWRERFYARREDVLKMYDERFFRMWDFYLTGSEISFRCGDAMNAQVQLEKRQGTVPLTRDYLAGT